MKKSFLLLIVILILVLIIAGCQSTEKQPEEEVSQQVEDTEATEELTIIDEGQESVDNREEYYASPFTGRAISEKLLNRVVMVSIENSPAARPQSGLEDADI